MKQDIFEVTADEAVIEERLKCRQLCFVLNQNLKTSRISRVLGKYYIMAVEYDGDMRHGAVCGLYREEREDYEQMATDTSETASAQIWQDAGDNPALEELIDDPLCILLSESLAPIQLEGVERVYETLDIVHEGKKRIAIACAYYDPNVELKGGVLSQEWRLKN